ncbi:MAG: hypothetical protein AAFX50_19945 [Acidobacteriota bacterium]
MHPSKRLVVAFFVVAALGAGPPGGSATFTVTNLADGGPGSLRQAILDSEATAAPPHTVTFDAGVEGTVELLSPLPSIRTPLSILGPGPDLLTVDAKSERPPVSVKPAMR